MRFKGKKAYKKLCKELKKWLKKKTIGNYYRTGIEKNDDNVYEITIYAKKKGD